MTIIKEENITADNQKTIKKGFSVMQLLKGEFLQKDYFLKNLPFLFYVAFLLTLYIANVYYAENKIREIASSEDKIKELHSNYITVKAQLTNQCKEHQLDTLLVSKGVKISTIPPKTISVNTNELKEIY